MEIIASAVAKTEQFASGILTAVFTSRPTNHMAVKSATFMSPRNSLFHLPLVSILGFFCTATNLSNLCIRICCRDNSKLASCGGDRQVFYWDVATGRVIRKFRGHDGEVRFFSKYMFILFIF